MGNPAANFDSRVSSIYLPSRHQYNRQSLKPLSASHGANYSISIPTDTSTTLSYLNCTPTSSPTSHASSEGEEEIGLPLCPECEAKEVRMRGEPPYSICLPCHWTEVVTAKREMLKSRLENFGDILRAKKKALQAMASDRESVVVGLAEEDDLGPRSMHIPLSVDSRDNELSFPSASPPEVDETEFYSLPNSTYPSVDVDTGSPYARVNEPISTLQTISNLAAVTLGIKTDEIPVGDNANSARLEAEFEGTIAVSAHRTTPDTPHVTGPPTSTLSPQSSAPSSHVIYLRMGPATKSTTTLNYVSLPNLEGTPTQVTVSGPIPQVNNSQQLLSVNQNLNNIPSPGRGPHNPLKTHETSFKVIRPSI